MKKDDEETKRKAAHRIIDEDRKQGQDYLLWALPLYQSREIYTALIKRGWVWSKPDRKWLNEEKGLTL